MSSSSPEPPVPADATAARYRRLAGNTVTLALGNLLGRLVGFVLIPLYTHMLTAAEYGTVDVLSATVEFALPLAFLVVNEAVLRFTMSSEEQPSQVLASTVLVFTVGCVLLGLTVPIAMHYVTDRMLLGWFYAVLVTQAAFLIAGAWARGIGRVSQYAAGGVVQAVVLGLSNVVLLVGLRAGMQGYLASIALSYAVGFGWLVWSTRIWRQSGPFRPQRALVSKMLAYSVPLIPNALMWWLMSTSSRWFLAGAASLSEIGLYGIAHRVSLVVILTAQIFVQAWQLSAFTEFNKPGAADFYSKVFEQYQAVLLLVVSGLVAVVKPVLAVVVEDSFTSAWRFVPWLLLAALFSNFAGYFGTVYTAALRTRGILLSSLLAGLVALVANLVLVGPLGGHGAGIASALAFAVLWGYRVIGSRRLLVIRVPWPRLLAGLVVIGGQIAALFLLTGSYGVVAQVLAVVLIGFLNASGLRRGFRAGSRMMSRG